MKSWIFAVALVSSVSAYAGDTVGNGAGLAQKNIVMAYSNVGRYIETCFNSPGCKTNQFQKNLLMAILQGFAGEKPVEFKSGKLNPGFFVINGETKVAKTGDHVGDIIYVNTDLIYSTDFDGSFHVMSVAEGAGLLIHELGHHYGVKDEVQLDLLGSVIQNAVAGATQRVESLFLISYVVGHATNFRSRDGLAQVWFTDGDSVEDVTRLVNSAIQCPGNAPRTGSNFSNIHWAPGTKVNPGLWTFRLRGYLVMFCKIPNPIQWASRNGTPVIVEAEFKWDGRQFQFVPGSSRLTWATSL